MKKVGRAESTALLIWSLPTWLRREEIPPNLLSHLLTRGKKS